MQQNHGLADELSHLQAGARMWLRGVQAERNTHAHEHTHYSIMALQSNYAQLAQEMRKENNLVHAFLGKLLGSF